MLWIDEAAALSLTERRVRVVRSSDDGGGGQFDAVLPPLPRGGAADQAGALGERTHRVSRHAVAGGADTDADGADADDARAPLGAMPRTDENEDDAAQLEVGRGRGFDRGSRAVAVVARCVAVVLQVAVAACTHHQPLS